METPVALVVDDDRGIRQLVGDLLRTKGAKVLVAGSANEGLATLHREPVDILFTDLRLPDGDGMAMLQEARKLHPLLPAIILTGYGSLDSSVEALRQGACDYLTKPITQQTLHSAWDRALRARRDSCIPLEYRRPESPRGKPGPSCMMVAESPAMREIVRLVGRIAPTAASVLIHGDPGVGKSLLARTIHDQSRRANGPFVRVSCTAIRDNDLESAFPVPSPATGTASERARSGFWEQAVGGTLFLEDVEGLPLRFQRRLLDALQERHRHRATDGDSRAADVRVIASTRCPLEQRVAEGLVLRGLYDELAVISIRIPPLRERPEDIAALSKHFLRMCAGPSAQDQDRIQFSPEACGSLTRHAWPGNVRELASVVERAVLLAEGPVIGPESLPQLVEQAGQNETRDTISVPLASDIKEIKREVITQVIQRCHGNKAAAARALGMHRRTLYRRLDHGPQP
jgi:two-component system response regulator AtoC